MSRKVPKEMFKANTGSPGQNCRFNISCTSGGPASGCCCTQNALTSLRSIQLADYAQPTWKQDNTSLVNVHRAAYSEKLLKNPVFQSAYIDRSLIKDPEFLTQLTLDASAVLDKEQFDNITWGLLELLTREYIHRIHHKRLAELKRLST